MSERQKGEIKSEQANETVALLHWYAERRRSFPWRDEPTPYRIWVSEIMLQQTRIEAVLPYFERFVQALPTVRALAEADEQVLLKLWEGLGYYSRVRNMQKAARLLCERYGGQLPSSYEALLTLPGIGEYTAGAIASIAYRQRVPAVDGNVLRVMARLTDDDRDVMNPAVRRELGQMAADLVPEDRPGEFNEAVMELGETVCLPHARPRCEECPLAATCRGRASGRAEQLPTRTVRTQRRVERRTIVIVTAEGRVLLHRRADKGLLAGLWELPGTEEVLDADGVAALVTAWGGKPQQVTEVGKAKHIFSHVEWQMVGFAVKSSYFTAKEGLRWVDARQLREEYALPSAFRAYTETVKDGLQTKEDAL